MTNIDDWTSDIHIGDAEATLAAMPSDSVHMMMTSPPYFGLRDYGEDGQIGLEDSLDEYIAELVAVFEEIRRVLRPDGSAWLNLGDSYATARRDHTGGDQVGGAPTDDYATREQGALGRKNKMLVPHRVAIELQEAGWIVRNDVTWVKPNPMPSSVKDRLNTTTEQVFHLTPEPDYYYDLDAIREPHSEEVRSRAAFGDDELKQQKYMTDSNTPPKVDRFAADGTDNNAACNPAGKNPGDVFEVTTKPFPEAHFAVYPPELCEKPIKATCPPKVCVDCGAPYEREVEVERENYGERADRVEATGGAVDGGVGKNFPDTSREFKGWTPTCDCDTDATEPGIVLDPFAGAGTTCLVAKELDRRFIGADLNPEYVAMAQRRLGLDVHDPSLVRDDAETGLEAFDA